MLATYNGHSAQPAPTNPEVAARPTRRCFTTDYKQRILREADRCTQPGQIASLLRREGLYSSHLSDWRKQQQQALSPRRRGRQAADEQLASENRQLKREKQQLERQLAQAEAIVELQKKVSALLGITLSAPENEGSDA